MKLILALFLLFSLNNLCGQRSNLEIRYGNTYDKELVDSVVNDFQERNEYVVSFEITSNWPRRSRRLLIITKQNDFISAYQYDTKSDVHLKKLNIPMDSLKNLWAPYITDLFELKQSKDISDDCSKDTSREGRIRYHKMFPEDSHSYSFLILSKTQMKKLIFYDPEFFEKYCGSVIERQKIIKCVLMIRRILQSAVVN